MRMRIGRIFLAAGMIRVKAKRIEPLHFIKTFHGAEKNSGVFLPDFPFSLVSADCMENYETALSKFQFISERMGRKIEDICSDTSHLVV